MTLNLAHFQKIQSLRAPSMKTIKNFRPNFGWSVDLVKLFSIKIILSSKLIEFSRFQPPNMLPETFILMLNTIFGDLVRQNGSSDPCYTILCVFRPFSSSKQQKMSHVSQLTWLQQSIKNHTFFKNLPAKSYIGC